MPGDFRCDRGDYARVLFTFAREAAGASRARHSLRPLSGERFTNSDASRREIANVYLHPSLRANGSAQSAARWLAMTISLIRLGCLKFESNDPVARMSEATSGAGVRDRSRTTRLCSRISLRSSGLRSQRRPSRTITSSPAGRPDRAGRTHPRPISWSGSCSSPTDISIPPAS
jgi:hypothetical protein